MRGLFLAVMTVATFLAINVTPSEAREYPFCMYSRSTSARGDCSFSTYAQCSAAASGTNAYCQPNYYLGAENRQYIRFRQLYH